MGDDAAVVGVNKIMIVVNEGLGDVAIDGKDVVIRREFGAMQAQLLAGCPAEFSVGGNVRMKNGLAHFI